MVVFEKGKYIDGYLQKNLEMLKKAVDLNWDACGFFSGFEGDGKTTLAIQLAYYVDRSFNLDRIVFTGDQFKDACLLAKNKEAIVFDESYYDFTSAATLTKQSRLLRSMLTMIRKKQLFIFIVAPTFFDIQKYIAVHRSRFLIHVYSKGLERGFFAFYNRARKQQLFMKGRRENNMSVTKPNFIGRFTKWFLVDEVAYDKKKESSIQQLEHEKTPVWACPKCLSRDSRASKGTVEVWCRKCGFVGESGDFKKKLKEAGEKIEEV